MSKKNLLIVTTTFPSGSQDVISARFVLDLAKALAAHYNVCVLTPGAAGAKKLEYLDGVKIYRFAYFWPFSLQLLTTGEGILANLKKNWLLLLQAPFLFIAELIAAARLIVKERIEVVNTHWIIPQGLIVALLKNFFPVKHILTVHAADVFLLKRWSLIGRILARYIIKRCDSVIAVSNYIKSVLDGLTGIPYQSRIMPMGVRPEFFSDRDPPSAPAGKERFLKILFVGKMSQKKGLRILLEALHQFKQRKNNFKLEVIGGGILEEGLKAYACELGLDDSVTFHGWVVNDKLPAFYEGCDIVAVPSLFDARGETEGMPVVILEAMAQARPVLASRVSGIPDVVVDGYNGWLVEPADPQAIARKLEDIYAIGDMVPYRCNAIETARRFSCDNVAKVYSDIIG